MIFKKLNFQIFNFVNIIVIFFYLFYPILLFLNRFLIADYSFDTINYHIFNGYRFFSKNIYEFYPLGIHSFHPFLDSINYIFLKFLGYRLGTISSLIYIFLIVFFSYKTIKLLLPNVNFIKKWWFGILFINVFFNFEFLIQIGTYYIDILHSLFFLISIYFLIKFEKNKNIFLYFLSIFFYLITLLSKLTTFYSFFGFLFLFIIIFFKNKKYFNINFFFIFIFLLPLLDFYLVNFLKTGNPVFPLFNAFFKSNYTEIENYSFSYLFGGRNLIEKLFFGFFSIFETKRLGEVEVLFNDYKINFYFFMIFFSLIFYLFNFRNKKFLKNNFYFLLLIFYFLIYFSWSIFFGYLRYAGFLEIFGGILLIYFLYIIEKNNFLLNKVFIFLIFILIFSLNLRIINPAKKYDYSWRQGFLNGNKNYFSELKKIDNNEIEVKVLQKDIDIYLNCTSPSLGYYVLSNFNNKPILNINKNYYSLLTMNKNYMEEQKNRVLKKYKDKRILNYATIVAYEGLDPRLNECLENLKSRKAFRIEKIEKTNFLGYERQKLAVILGTFNLDDPLID